MIHGEIKTDATSAYLELWAEPALSWGEVNAIRIAYRFAALLVETQGMRRPVLVTGGWDGHRVRVTLHGRPGGDRTNRDWDAEVTECAAILWCAAGCRVLARVRIARPEAAQV